MITQGTNIVRGKGEERRIKICNFFKSCGKDCTYERKLTLLQLILKHLKCFKQKLKTMGMLIFLGVYPVIHSGIQTTI